MSLSNTNSAQHLLYLQIKQNCQPEFEKKFAFAKEIMIHEKPQF